MPHKRVDEYDLESEILPFLAGVEGGNGHWMCWCPCHADEGTSMKGLSISQVGRRNLAKCHSCGATLSDVIDAIEGGGSRNGQEEIPVSVTRHSSNSNGMSWWVDRTGVPQEIWEGMGVEEYGSGVKFTFGEESFFKYRKPPKEFGWQGTSDNDAPPLWPIPDEELPQEITITEGESDCGTARAAGLPLAFSLTKGAKSQLTTPMFMALKDCGVETVLLCGDADRAGEEFLARTTREALGAGLNVRTVRLQGILNPLRTTGNDLNYVYREADSLKHFLKLVERCTVEVAKITRTYSITLLEEEANKEETWLIPELIAPGDKVLISGPPKSYKSWFALEMARSIATCTPFLRTPDWKAGQPAQIGYVQEEGSRSAWARRVSLLNLSAEVPISFAHRTGFRFSDSSYTDELIAVMREEEWEVVILDPLQRMMAGLDENSASETAVVWDEVFRMQQAIPGLVVCVVHHSTKGQTLSWESSRGTSRHGGEVDVGFFLQREKEDAEGLNVWLDGRDIPHYMAVGESLSVHVEISKEKKLFQMQAGATVKVSARPQNPNRDAILKAIQDGCDTRTKIMHQLNLAENTVGTHLKVLVDENKVVAEDQGEGKPKLYTPAE
jgi:DNA-binding transcriptional ArsR family regulator